MAYTVEHFGWIRDIPDHRDFLYAAPLTQLSALPTQVDLRSKCPPIYDQGRLGSCTGNGIAGAIQFDRKKQGFTPDFVPSRLFIYYNERVILHTVNSDSGARIRDGIKSVAKQGDCPEGLWPYDIDRFTEKPADKCYKEALKYKAVQYQRLMQTISQMKACLAEGYPFVFGFTCYESLRNAEVGKTGAIPLPKQNEQVIGGHCVLGIGYDDAEQVVIIRNSWGNSWGMDGYGTIPYAYLTNPDLAADFWTIRAITK
jgi:C1A family cysteine protease